VPVEAGLRYSRGGDDGVDTDAANAVAREEVAGGGEYALAGRERRRVRRQLRRGGPYVASLRRRASARLTSEPKNGLIDARPSMTPNSADRAENTI